MPHSYWLRPRRQRINYSESRPYRNLRSIRSSQECSMAQRMLSAATQLELVGDYFMNNATTLSLPDYVDGRADDARASTFIESIQSIAATIITFIYRFMVAIARKVTSIVTFGRLTHPLPIFTLLLLSGLLIISDPSNMSQFPPRKSEPLNTNLLTSLNSQSLISYENKYDMPLKKPLKNSLAVFSHIRSDVKKEFSAQLAKLVRSLVHEALMSNQNELRNFVQSLVDEALMKFYADKTGMADFALESGGGSVIITHSSETFTNNSAVYRIFGIPIYYKSNSPRTVIQPDVNVGECWSFRGSSGTLVIKLSHQIKITAFSIEHIHKSISPFGHIESAPKDFSVYSLTEPGDHRAVLLGNFTYKDNDKTIQQFFPQVANVKPTRFVKLLITSNHGNLEYTCLYRFRVHGVLRPA